jgi:hypothetical protein
MQTFMTRMEAAFKQHPVWASAPPEHQAQAVEVFTNSNVIIHGLANNAFW